MFIWQSFERKKVLFTRIVLYRWFFFGIDGVIYAQSLFYLLSYNSVSLASFQHDASLIKGSFIFLPFYLHPIRNHKIERKTPHHFIELLCC